MFITSGTGKVEKQILQIVADYIQDLGLRLIRYDKPPFLGVSVKAGDRKGEVLSNKQAIEECRTMVQKLLKDLT